jgi:histidinol phosphatase-like PHP family hydrolase
MVDIKIIDLHTHTDSSQDGNHPVEYMAEVAAQNGIQTVAFTDHCEVDVFYKDGFGIGRNEESL